MSEESQFLTRIATAKDCDPLIQFNLRLAAETESKSLDPDVVRRGVIRGLKAGNECQYFVAEPACFAKQSQGQAAVGDSAFKGETGEGMLGPVGCLMLTREWSDWRDGWIAWLQSVYVMPEWRSKGVFTALLDHSESEMRREPDVVGMRLYVEKDNRRAQEVYARRGFRDPHYQVLEKMF